MTCDASSLTTHSHIDHMVCLISHSLYLYEFREAFALSLHHQLTTPYPLSAKMLGCSQIPLAPRADGSSVPHVSFPYFGICLLGVKSGAPKGAQL